MGKAEKEKPFFAELSEDGRYIEIYFAPDPHTLDVMHQIGASFRNKEKVGPDGTPHWRIPLDFFAAKELTDAVGGKDQIQLGDALEGWAWEVVELQESAAKILAETDTKLQRLPKVLPKLYEAIHLGPLGKEMSAKERKEGLKKPASFQATDVKYMAHVPSALNGNQMGTGKTLEYIASVYEAGMEDGAHLVVAPLGSLQAVWEKELTEWQDLPVFRANGEGMLPRDQAAALRSAELAIAVGRPFWLLINPEMVRLEKKDPGQGVQWDNLESKTEFIHESQWKTIVIDEAHRNALRSLQTVTAYGMRKLQTEPTDNGKRMSAKAALTGTPLGGKPINFFGIFHWLDPQRFPSRSRWARQWLETEEGDYALYVGDVQEEKQEEFDKMLNSIMVRRTKAEVLPWLPPKQFVELWCGMTPTQAEQYTKFKEMAMLELEDTTLTATNILAIYTRLKQFASAKQRFEDGRLIATEDSGKIDMLMEKLDELGIFDSEGDSQALVFSQFTSMVDVIYTQLEKRGVPVVKIVGGQAKRAEVQRAFQEGEARVCVMSTKAGGVSITLDRADSVFMMDETWNPDDQEQAEDRAHRASRIHQVTVYYLRTSGTLEQYIKEVTDNKGRINKKTLDERRLRLS